MVGAPIALIGSEEQENLSLRYLAGALRAAGLRSSLIRFEHQGQTQAAIARVMQLQPFLAGLSLTFQSRAPEFIALAAGLRAAGYRGHLTAGGHFATIAFRELLAHVPALDSVVRHEGEVSLVELCRTLLARGPTAPITGVVLRDPRRPATDLLVGPARPLADLDELPWPDRSGEPQRILGVPYSPMIGSRGCHGACTFCSIHAYYSAARGPGLRRRQPEALAAEMLHEHQSRGVRLFGFEDDNFLTGDERGDVERLERLNVALRRGGMPPWGLIVKARPDDLTPAVVAALDECRVLRVFVGIENGSDHGLRVLGRGMRVAANEAALQLLERQRLVASYNLLLFGPDTTWEDLEATLSFLARWPAVPYNFCRVEVYAGTPLETRLRARGRLRGSFLAWDYDHPDARLELAARICGIAFGPRNFRADGLALRAIALRTAGQVARRVLGHDDPALEQRLCACTQAIGRDTARHLRRALDWARQADPADRAAARDVTLTLARDLARSDLELHHEVHSLQAALAARVAPAASQRPAHPLPPEEVRP